MSHAVALIYVIASITITWAVVDFIRIGRRIAALNRDLWSTRARTDLLSKENAEFIELLKENAEFQELLAAEKELARKEAELRAWVERG